MTKRYFTLLLITLTTVLSLNAQTFDFDMAKDGKGMKSGFLSVEVPDGNYLVRVTFGSKKRAGETTLRCENRRLLAHNLVTKKKEMKTLEFVVNKRSPFISDDRQVRIKEREKNYFTWDDKLTLEIAGDAPAVASIHIEPAKDVPTIYLCGNSTVVDQAYEPWASWGQMITRWFGPEVAVSNHAESGLAAFSFIAQNRLDKIMTTLKKGDWVIVEFGHNDEKYKGNGFGAWYHYSYNLKIFVDRVRKAGAEIIFCTPTQRRAWESDNKTIKNTHGDYPAAMKALAERENVPVIDLNSMTKTFFETLGYEDSKRALVHYPMGTFEGQTKPFADNTHFNPYGAYEVAKLVVLGMKQQNLPMVKYLRDTDADSSEWKNFSPATPDDWKTFKWVPSPMTEFLKPDGN